MQACQFNGGELVAVASVLPGRYHSKREKGGLDSPPLPANSDDQKLNVMPLEMALSVAPPIVSLAASREHI